MLVLQVYVWLKIEPTETGLKVVLLNRNRPSRSVQYMCSVFCRFLENKKEREKTEGFSTIYFFFILEIQNSNFTFILHSSFPQPGKALFPQSEWTSVKAQHLHPQQPLGRFSKRTRVHGGRESAVINIFLFLIIFYWLLFDFCTKARCHKINSELSTLQSLQWNYEIIFVSKWFSVMYPCCCYF